ncbi:MAG: hypothetical protein LBC92_02970 [Rickettsiales bacterium]|jgi:predicted Holliday junction resolvase-like endonuclease|nr:hypothetical protein [Rickettsiales bacterium]
MDINLLIGIVVSVVVAVIGAVGIVWGSVWGAVINKKTELRKTEIELKENREIKEQELRENREIKERELKENRELKEKELQLKEDSDRREYLSNIIRDESEDIDVRKEAAREYISREWNGTTRTYIIKKGLK